MNSWVEIAFGAGLVAGAGLGAWFWAWRLRHKAIARLRVPERWPLSARRMVGGNEKEVWVALRNIFHEHVVMVKVPVLRYTKLNDAEKFNVSAKDDAKAHFESERLQEILVGLYTTFTICTTDGKVVGCVDLLGKVALPKTNRNVKEALLLECGIAYSVINATAMPDAIKLRALFLGELPLEPLEHQVTRGGDSNFHADLTAFTKQQDNLLGAHEPGFT